MLKTFTNKILTSLILSFIITTNTFAAQKLTNNVSSQTFYNTSREALNARAYGLYLKGQTKAALTLYKKGLALYPHSADLYDGAGLVYLKNKQYSRAYDNFAIASQIEPASSIYKIHAHDAIYKSNINKVVKAKYLMSKAFSLAPNNSGIIKNYQYIQENKFRSLEMLYCICSSLKDLNISKGNEAFWKKDFKKAEQFYLKSIKLKKNNYEALNNLGLVYMETASYNNAADYFKKSININPAFYQAYNNLGITNSRLNKFEDAIRAFDLAISMNSANAYNNKAVSSLNSILKSIDSSIMTLETIIKTETSNILAKQLLGQFLLLNESYNSAVNVYKSGIEQSSDNYNYLKQYADCLYAAGQYQESVNWYKKAILIDAEKSDIYVNLAKAYDKNNDVQSAFTSYKTSMRLKSNNPNTYKNFGLFLLSQKRNAEAKGYLRKYLQIYPNSFDSAYIKQLIL
jgi:tetratricopeptide (TPR) repeat protein